MTQPSDDDLRLAFCQAVRDFQVSWSPAPHGPEPSLGQEGHSIEALCWLVSGFNDPLPEETCNELRGYVDASRPDLKEKLSGNPSYATGGRCLQSLMEDQKAAYARSFK